MNHPFDVPFAVEGFIRDTGLDLEDYLEIYELFQENFQELMGELEQALAGNDTEKVLLTAHTLKGITSSVGFMDLADIAREIQENPGDLKRAAEATTEMRALYEVLDRQVTAIPHVKT